MHPARAAALALLAAAVGLLAWGFARGEVQVAFLLFFPILYGGGPIPVLAFLCLLGAFVAWAFGSVAMARGPADGAAFPEPGAEPPEPPGEPGRRTRGGGVVLIGPFPIIFGSDAGVVKWLVALALALMVAATLFLVVRSRLGP